MTTGDSRELQLEWAGWTQVWWLAAQRQAGRIEDAEFDEMEPDILLFAQALDNLARGARRVLGAGHPDMQVSRKALPQLKDLRDMFEHFDEYVEGAGFGQQRGQMREDPFITFFSRTEGRDHTAMYLGDTAL